MRAIAVAVCVLAVSSALAVTPSATTDPNPAEQQIDPTERTTPSAANDEYVLLAEMWTTVDALESPTSESTPSVSIDNVNIWTVPSSRTC